MKSLELWTFILLFCSASCDLYSSVVGLEKLLQTENKIIQIYRSFVFKTEQQISELKRQIEKLEKEHKNTTIYENDPFISFHLVKRILVEWAAVENVLSDRLLQETRDNITELQISNDFPTNEDLSGTADAINLISDIYNIEITSLADGVMNGIQYPSHLSAYDCYILGIQSYLRNDFHHTYSWLDEALKRFRNDRNTADADMIEKALDIKAYSAYKLGDLSIALNITTELLNHYPNNSEAPGNIEYYKYMLNRKEVPKPKVIQHSMPDSDIAYRNICRKTILSPVEITPQLKCHYVHNDVPFLRLAPLKEEEAFLNPRIVLFKDALYDSEIKLLKEMVKSELHSALVVNTEEDGDEIYSINRVAQLNWIKRNDHPRMRTILQRAEDMTKLDPYCTDCTEDLQVVNYAVGGLYKPHFDSLEDYGLRYVEKGDRIATLLY
ncbi:unnamed protein product [Nezara viridula]|nr:unnamed protein product [Nezara viridula]